jgi:ankyrin repeat protein
VQTRQLPLIIELLNRGAEVDRKNKSGKRPIHIALELEPKRGYDPPPDAKKQAIAGMLLARGAVYDVWTACALGDFDTVEALLNDDPEAAKTYDRPDYYPGADGYPLVVAAYYGHLEIVRLLLEHGADPDTPYDQYNGYHVAECGAPLLWACTNNDYEIAKLLLEHGANADTVKDASGNALDRAVQAQNDHMIKLLLRHGAIPGYDGKVNPGFYAMHGDDITTDATLLRMHPEVAGDMLGKALGGGHPDLVAMCLEYLPQIDDQHGLGLLGGASRMWRLRMPLNPGNAKPTDFYECFELLLKHGINPNARTPEGLTMLHLLGGPSWRTTHEADRIVFAGLLLDYGAEINIIGGELKSTPLGFAVRNGWFKLAEYLLGRGADPNLAGEPWATPLAWSEQGGHTEIAEILRKHGAKT